MKQNKMKVALVYDRVNTKFGGAENVLLELHRLFPSAPLFTSIYDPEKAKWANDFVVFPSFLQKLPFFLRNHRLLAPLMPLAFESFDFSDYQVIISITSAEAKGVITKPNQHHICYLLTPPRYLYSHKKETLASSWILDNFVGKFLANMFIKYLIWWDRSAIHRPDFIIPISQRVAKRVKKYYSIVRNQIIYPPISTRKYISSINKKNYFLVVSRLVYYKKIDLVIKACQMLNENLIIVGDGPDYEKLYELASQKQSQSQIIFYKNVSRKKLEKIYEESEGVIVAGEEDFGIVALEANSFGKPVAIYNKSGAAELIEDGKHGFHIRSQNVSDIIEAIKKLKKTRFSAEMLVKNAEKYDTNRFRENLSKAINNFLLSKGIKI
jgi:glycosyltransferase involved in cell wall biosynthesis